MKNSKRKFSLVMSLLIVLSLFQSIMPVASAEGKMMFDIDKDGYATAADARMVLRIAANLDTCAQEDMQIIDFDGNNKIVASDARRILIYSAMADDFENAAPVRKSLDYDRSQSRTKLLITNSYNSYDDTITVIVSGENMAGTQAANLFLKYDPEKLEFQQLTKITEGIDMLVGTSFDYGLATAAFLSLNSVTNDSESIAFKFSLKTTEDVQVECSVGTWIGTDVPADVTAVVRGCDHSDVEIRGAYDATFQMEGYTGDKFCVSCDKLIENGTVIPMLGEFENKYRYKIENGGAVITKFHSTPNLFYYVVPSTLGGYPVVGIAEGAFMDCEIAEIAFPDSIQFVEYPAFGSYNFNGELTVSASLVFYGNSGGAIEKYATDNSISFITDDFGSATGYELAPGTDVVVYNDVRYIMLDSSRLFEYFKADVKKDGLKCFELNGFQLLDTHSVKTGYKVLVRDVNGEYTSEYCTAIRGDANGNGVVNAADARIALRVSAGLEKIDGACYVAADMNSDGKTTAADARTILRKAAGLGN